MLFYPSAPFPPTARGRWGFSTKGSAVISSSGHVPARSRIYSDQKIDLNFRGKPENLVWAFPTGPRGENLEGNPYDI